MKEAELIKECLKGKITAQKQLYDTFAPVMLGVCFRYTKSLHDAQDILQEGFIKVFQFLHQYRKEGDLGAWIRRIMINTALAYLKKNQRYQSDMLMKDEVMHKVSDENPSVKLDTKQLTELIRQLPSGYQTIFNLHAIEGYSHVEIAGMLGISEGTSRSQYMRARNLLITWINKYNDDQKKISYA
ncbi:MAG: polymerase sigma-70 factor [Chitinophagaceae bacterium]|nr:polymerase sigma-70 factor [Chitinophagaceae bacterium]